MPSTFIQNKDHSHFIVRCKLPITGSLFIFSHMVRPIKSYIVRILVFACSLSAAVAQSNYASYGKKIYSMIIENNKNLMDEFIDLRDYTAYIDRLEKLPAEEKEAIKWDASRSYADVLKDYEVECTRILNLYAQSKREGITFTFSTAEFKPNKNFPNIGILTFYYMIDIPGFEEPEEDGLRFECIKTSSGWRILDGFFELN
jgi:CRISPR/Cas system CMR-associated protein Cmr5 small subunit